MSKYLLEKANGQPAVIMQVLPNLEQGGVERGTADVSKAITKAGGKSIVVSNGGKIADEIMIAKAHHIKLPVHTKNVFKMISNVFALKKLIKEYDVDIVHARSRAPAWSCYFACKKSTAKFVTTFHAKYKFSNRIKRKYNSVMAKGDRVVSISKFIKKYINENYALDNSKIDVVIRGVELEKFNPEKVTNETMSKIINDWHIPEGNPVVLCPGRLSKIKGQKTLIEAAKILKDRGINDVSYVFLGSDQGRVEYSQMLLDEIAKNDLKDNFYMISGTNDMPTAYTISDVVACLSVVEEGFGRVPIEAFAMGRPVIATKLGGFLETVVDGKVGALIDKEDSKALADNIEKYLKMTARQKTMFANKAKKHVKENFSSDVMMKSLFSVYNSLLEDE